MNYRIEWISTPVLLLALVLPVVAPPFALIGLLIIAVGALASLVAAAGLVLATPFLLARFIRRHHAERQRASEGSRRAHRLTEPAVAPLANPTAARS